MSKSRDTVEAIRTALLDADIGTSVLAPDGDGSNLTGLNAVVVGSTLPSNGAAAASLFYRTSNNKLYISDGSIWSLVANLGPATTGGTVVIPSVVESSGSYSYNLGIDFTDDANTDAELTYSLLSGSLPTGAVMPTTGNTSFTGTIPTVSSDTIFTFQIRATDTSGVSTVQNYQWTITNAVPITTGGTVTITGVDGGDAISYDVDTDFTFPASASFSAFSLQSGALPNGVTLNTSTGVISGTVLNVSATYTFTIRATDTDGDVSDQSYSLPVVYTATAATGGSPTTYGIYKVHTFTTSGNLNVTTGGAMEAFLVGGGGGADGNYYGSGGGGGGIYYNASFIANTQNYVIAVGAGGLVNSVGGNTTAFGVTATGGAAGVSSTNGNAGPNGSGGGYGPSVGASVGGIGSLPAVNGWTAHGGFDGGSGGYHHWSGGGAGAGGNGIDATNAKAGSGGNGHQKNMTGPSSGTDYYWAGGGGGGSYGGAHGPNDSGDGGLGGGGGGGNGSGTSASGSGGTGGINTGFAGNNTSGGQGGTNTGAGGGAGTGGNGASGIVIVRYVA